MAVSTLNKTDKENLMQEFVNIVNDAKARILADKQYPNSSEFLAQSRRMSRIMTLIEGCGCQGRAEQLRAMLEGLKAGRPDVIKAFTPLIFKSFARDIGKFIKVL